MGFGTFSKFEATLRRKQAERETRSVELRLRLIEKGVAVLKKYAVREAWLFGSVAAGKADSGSDLDLLVVPVEAADYWPLRRDLEEVLGCPLDLYTQADDAVLVRKVVERGERIL